MEIREYILHRVTNQYLATEDFNGLSGLALIAELGENAAVLEELIREQLISLNSRQLSSESPHQGIPPTKSR